VRLRSASSLGFSEVHPHYSTHRSGQYPRFECLGCERCRPLVFSITFLFYFTFAYVRANIRCRQTSMRWTVCLLIIFLSGCQGMPLLNQLTEDAPPSVMPLWEHFQHCLVTTDPTELALIIEKFDAVPQAEVEPPTWMRAWGKHVTGQPVRTAVDPQALGAACTLRAAAVMAEAERQMEAQALYRRVLERYSSRDWAYYVDLAKEKLTALQDPTSAVVALRSDRTASR
jgi:hypothetical protein